MYCIPLLDILGKFPVWSLAIYPSRLYTNSKTIFVLYFLGSWVGTAIAPCIASVLSDCCVILSGSPRLDFMVVDLVPCCVCFM